MKFFRQYGVGKYILDFYCPAIRLCLEIDGGQHNQNPNDARRDNFLKSINIKVLRFWNNEINENFEGVYQKLHATCQALIANSPHPSLFQREGEIMFHALIPYAPNQTPPI